MAAVSVANAPVVKSPAGNAHESILSYCIEYAPGNKVPGIRFEEIVDLK